MAMRPWLFENLESNGVGFATNGLSRWEVRRYRAAFGLFLLLELITILVQLVVLDYLSRGATSSHPTMPSFPVMMLIFVGPNALVVILCLYVIGSTRGAVREAARRGGYACPGCLYDLSADRVERCPECGQHVEYDMLPTLWTRKVRRRFLWSRETRFDETGFDSAGRSRYEGRARRLAMWMSLLVPLGAFGPMMIVQHGMPGLKSGWSMGFTLMVEILASVLGLVVFAGPLFFLLNRRMKRLRRALEVSGGMACPECLCDLSDGPVERCPDCGQAVDYATLGRMWSVKMKMLGIEQGSGRDDHAGGCG